ncbi:MAG TPA: glycosyltransferase family 87 protein, partial [Bryobacteraceae bacterium]
MKQPISFAKTFIPLSISIGLFFFYCWAQNGPTSTAKNDFPPFYAAGKLVAEGKLFDVDAMYGWHQKLIGGVVQNGMWIRPPFYALLYEPLALLPYKTAYIVFLAVNLAALIGFVFLMRKRSPTIALTCSLCLPVLLALGNGQDVAILLFLFALCIHYLDQGDDFIAGLVLSLCAIKAQFFVLVPLVLLWNRRWRFLSGGSTGAAILIALSFYAGGPHWISEYRRVLARPDNNQTSWQMGNLRAFSDGLAGGAPLQFTLVAIAVGFFLWMIVREKDLGAGLGLALLAGLLISPHGYMQ